MKNNLIIYLTLLLSMSCTSSKDILYLQDVSKDETSNIGQWLLPEFIQVNDVLHIEVKSTVPEASIVYNLKVKQNQQSNIQMLQLEGYIVDEKYNIDFPVLGKINVKNLTISDLKKLISSRLLDEKFLKDGVVSVRYLNKKFTVLGEVRSPGTFHFLDKNMTILQALGYSGDLSPLAKRKNITIIREINGKRTVAKLDLRNSKILDSQFYYIKNNDVIVVNPNFNAIKSSGFIGSPQTIASISSLFLSIALLFLNN